MEGSAVSECLLKAASGGDLTRAESRLAFGEIMEAKTSPEILSAFLTALKMKGETVEEIVGAAQAMRARAAFINAGPRVPVDTCGTGGDGLCTFNISTTSAFIAAGAGVCVAKHGNRAASGKCGSADVLAELGFNLDVHPAVMEHCLQQNCIAFLFAPKMHPAMRYAAPVRKALGFRTIFNLLGPLVNPAGAVGQVVGVFSAAHTEVMAACLQQLGCKRAFVVHGADGMDEMSVCAQTRVSELRNGQIKTYEFSPGMFFDRISSPEELRGGDARRNAEITRGILSGRIRGGAMDVCLLNAAAAIMAAGLAGDFRRALELARNSLDSGAAEEKLEILVKFSRQ